MTSATGNEHKGARPAMKTPPIVSSQAWEAALAQLLVKEKAHTRARDALAAERRRMPWMAVEKAYEFDGPKGTVSLPDLFEGRRQLIVYRAFFCEPAGGAAAHGFAEAPWPIVFGLTATAAGTLAMFFFPDVFYALATSIMKE